MDMIGYGLARLLWCTTWCIILVIAVIGWLLSSLFHD
jgi:hypothetical protein